MKAREFFNKMSKEDMAFIKIKNNNIYYKANIDYIISSLKTQVLLPQDYTLEMAEAEYNANVKTGSILVGI
jgi:hypothetical protein